MFSQNFHELLIKPNLKTKSSVFENTKLIKGSADKNKQLFLNLANQITKESLKEHILVLAADSLEGREVGTKGELLAAEYISNFFKNINIPPYKNDTYYQEFELGSRKFKNTEIKIDNNTYIFGEDFYSYPKFKNTSINTNDIVFLGYGINSDNYNDYIIDVKNKVVVVLEGEPKDKNGVFLN